MSLHIKTAFALIPPIPTRADFNVLYSTLGVVADMWLPVRFGDEAVVWVC